jgi:hypothetical protein
MIIGLLPTLFWGGATGNPIVLSFLKTLAMIFSIFSALASIPFLGLLFPLSIIPLSILSSLFYQGPQRDLVINVVAIGTAIVPDKGPPRPINTMMITPLSKH